MGIWDDERSLSVPHTQMACEAMRVAAIIGKAGMHIQQRKPKAELPIYCLWRIFVSFVNLELHVNVRAA